MRKNRDFARANVKTVFLGSETIKNIGPQIWDLLPVDIKMSATLGSFKSKVKLSKPENCHVWVELPPRAFITMVHFQMRHGGTFLK